MTPDRLIKLAENLAAAATRESYMPGGFAGARVALEAAIIEYGKAERERALEEAEKACYEIVDSAWALWKVTADPNEQGRSIGAENCSDAIRALKEKPCTN